MAGFGWAYLSGAVTGLGPSGSIQYPRTLDGELTGSNNFVFDQDNNKLSLTGSLIVSGTIQANTFDIIHTTRVDIEYSGSTSFGNSSDDIHQNTGSVYMDGLSAQALGNAQTITKDTILRENHNAVLYGPITIDASFTINLGSKVKIKDFDDI